MTNATLHCFAEAAGPARELAVLLGVERSEVEVRRFPDGESLVRVGETGPVALLYRSLDDPNAKLVEVLLAATALRDRGARQVILIAPYLAYMRQDMAFRPGEAVSQRVIGRLLAGAFDGVLTIDPHLHRVHTLGEVVPDIPAIAITAAPVLAAAIDHQAAPILAGPDAEARQWVSAVATRAGLPFILGTKQRRGDRDVAVTFKETGGIAGRRVLLIDDLISSGRTLIDAAAVLYASGVARVDALAVHSLASAADIAAMHAAGIASIRATESVAGPLGQLPIAPALAQAIIEQGWTGAPRA